MAEIVDEKVGYPFIRVFEIESNGAEAIDLMEISPATTIELVEAIITEAGVGTGNLIVGDDDNDDGFLEGVDATSVAGTISGDDPTERGAYLYDSTKKGSFIKSYTAAKTLSARIDAATLTTECKATIIVKGFKYDPVSVI